MPLTMSPSSTHPARATRNPIEIPSATCRHVGIIFIELSSQDQIGVEEMVMRCEI